MAVEIVPFTPEREEAVRAFNLRLAQAQYEDFSLPDSAPAPDDTLKGWLATEQGMVRGGYFLQLQEFCFSGQPSVTGFYNLSLSESVINKAFANVSIQMLRSAIALEPKLFALGMGGLTRPLPRFLKAMGWKLAPVPFYFYTIRPARMVRQILPFREPLSRRILANAAAWSGAATIGIGMLQRWKRRKQPSAPKNFSVEKVESFGPWADEIWNSAAARCAMIAPRDAAALDALYPSTLQRIHRLKMSHGAKVIGWAVVRNTRMQGHKQFGDLHVGTIVDCLAASPHDCHAVIRASVDFLKDAGVDLIISNHSHREWCTALERAGFMQGPSNYIFAASKELARRIDPWDQAFSAVHITRGDGDGPIHL